MLNKIEEWSENCALFVHAAVFDRRKQIGCEKIFGMRAIFFCSLAAYSKRFSEFNYFLILI